MAQLGEGTRLWKLLEIGENGLLWPQSVGVKMRGTLRLEMGCLGLSLSDQVFGADLRLWAILSSQDLVQTAYLAACDLGRGPRLQCSELGPACSRARAGVLGEGCQVVLESRCQRGPQMDTWLPRNSEEAV